MRENKLFFMLELKDDRFIFKTRRSNTENPGPRIAARMHNRHDRYNF